MRTKIIAVIPAYEPPSAFIDYAKKLLSSKVDNLIVVNDGSSEKYSEIFNNLAKLGVKIITYPRNMGKGFALKTAFSYIKDNVLEPYVVVTADCDGQHLVNDVITCAERATLMPNALTLGVRDFKNENVPKRSRFGNVATRRTFKILYGIDITDTQTGLRAFTNNVIDKVISVTGNGFEYEMNMLVSLYKLNVTFQEVKIETVYEEKQPDVNKRSHFKTFRDSVKVWGALFNNVKTYLLAILLSGIVEYGVFALCEFLIFSKFYPAVGTLFSTIIARTLSSIVNYLLNFKLVFKGNDKKAIVRYYVLWGSIMGASFGLIHLFANVLGFNVILVKLVADLVLSAFSYYIQTVWVFPHKKTVA